MFGLGIQMDNGYLGFDIIWESNGQNPKVWIERGRLESNGPPLLKNRKRMRRGLQ